MKILNNITFKLIYIFFLTLNNIFWAMKKEKRQSKETGKLHIATINNKYLNYMNYLEQVLEEMIIIKKELKQNKDYKQLKDMVKDLKELEKVENSEIAERIKIYNVPTEGFVENVKKYNNDFYYQLLQFSIGSCESSVRRGQVENKFTFDLLGYSAILQYQALLHCKVKSISKKIEKYKGIINKQSIGLELYNNIKNRNGLQTEPVYLKNDDNKVASPQAQHTDKEYYFKSKDKELGTRIMRRPIDIQKVIKKYCEEKQANALFINNIGATESKFLGDGENNLLGNEQGFLIKNKNSMKNIVLDLLLLGKEDEKLF